MRAIAHVSDLHVGRGRGPEAIHRLADRLDADDVEVVIVTGDITDRGRAEERERFERAFASLRRQGRLAIVPGNHDRLGDDPGRHFQSERIVVETRPGLHLVRFDSTGPHNRNLLAGHGMVTEEDLEGLGEAFLHAPAGSLRVLALHHHPLPLPEEGLHERFVSWLGLPNAAELRAGWRLVATLRGRCDLVLHGHRHVPASTRLFVDDARPLALYNAGSTPELGRYRVFRHQGGRLMTAPLWHLATHLSPSRHARATPAV